MVGVLGTRSKVLTPEKYTHSLSVSQMDLMQVCAANFAFVAQKLMVRLKVLAAPLQMGATSRRIEVAINGDV